MSMSKAQFTEAIKHGKAPDIAVRFKCNGDDKHSYRVTGWIKLVSPESMKTDKEKNHTLDALLNKILIDSAQKKDGKLMVWCTREEATHVTGYGVSGITAAIEDIECDGYVNWDQETIDRERASALRRVGEYID